MYECRWVPIANGKSSSVVFICVFTNLLQLTRRGRYKFAYLRLSESRKAASPTAFPWIHCISHEKNVTKGRTCRQRLAVKSRLHRRSGELTSTSFLYWEKLVSLSLSPLVPIAANGQLDRDPQLLLKIRCWTFCIVPKSLFVSGTAITGCSKLGIRGSWYFSRR
jgi:hypothetical protein